MMSSHNLLCGVQLVVNHVGGVGSGWSVEGHGGDHVVAGATQEDAGGRAGG